jgi:hypothetical protein
MATRDFLGGDNPVDQSEQGRLAGAVASHDAPALTRGDGERDVCEEGRRPELHRDSGE